MLSVDIYRYQPDSGPDARPQQQRYDVEDHFRKRMVLDVLEHLKSRDPTLTYRRSCREGVCGSDGMNINGVNRLACITPVEEVLGSSDRLNLRPLPGMPVIRDLTVDMTQFFKQYHSVKPWLQNDSPSATIERLQSPKERARLDGLYECILCACCSSGCPSWWWNPERYVGPAGLLQAWRFISDSRDTATDERLRDLEGNWRLYRCRGIQNCTYVCPKKLNPLAAIDAIKREILQRES